MTHAHMYTVECLLIYGYIQSYTYIRISAYCTVSSYVLHFPLIYNRGNIYGLNHWRAKNKSTKMLHPDGDKERAKRYDNSFYATNIHSLDFQALSLIV